MSKYCIKTDYVKAVKKTMRRLGPVTVSNSNIFGEFSIVGLRKYSYSIEVDIEFTGKVLFRMGHNRQFFDSSILQRYNASKIKINRIIKKYLLKEVRMRVNYFDLDMRYYSDIKKITWK